MVDHQDEIIENNSETVITNGENPVEEATSTTPIPLTKQSLRQQVWNKFDEKRYSLPFWKHYYNRIPLFKGIEKAGELFVETDEYKNANVILNRQIRNVQDLLISSIVKSGKTYYVSSQNDSEAIYTKLSITEDDLKDRNKMRKLMRDRSAPEYWKDINVDEREELDIVIIGAVAVSRDGYTIGKGHGYVDLNIGALIQAGSITNKTIIVTLVHDCQVFDTLPSELFEKHDAPIDVIVTPTQIIRPQKRLTRPAGIYWDILSNRRIEKMKYLRFLKEKAEESNKITELKEDTDIEEVYKNMREKRERKYRSFRYMSSRPRMYRDIYPRGRSYRNNRVDRTQTNGNTRMNSMNNHQYPHPRRTFYNRKTSKPNPEREFVREKNDQNNENNRKTDVKRKQRTERFNRENSFAIKLSKIQKPIRFKEIKDELRNRNCKPVGISWKPYFGKCYLHFKYISEEKQDDIKNVLEMLNNLTITVTNEEETNVIPLEVEVVNSNSNSKGKETNNHQLESIDSSTA